MMIDFPGGSQVDAHFKGFSLPTDQPPASRTPTPFEPFLTSIGTCAEIYVLGFCQQRELPTERIQIGQRVHTDPSSGMFDEIDIEILVPPTLPVKYYDSLIRAAELCKVKKHLENSPRFNVTTKPSHA